MEEGQIIKTFKSKKEHDVVIRYPKKEDVEDVLAYANKLIAEDTTVQLSGQKKTREEEERYLADSISRMKAGELIPLFVYVNGAFAGSGEVRRQPYRKHHVGEMGISLAKEYRDEGIGSVLFGTLIEEAKKLGLKLLYIHCFEGNDRAIHMYEKFGFKNAGLLPGAIEYRGSYIGEITMFLPLSS